MSRKLDQLPQHIVNTLVAKFKIESMAEDTKNNILKMISNALADTAGPIGVMSSPIVVMSSSMLD